MDRKCPKCRRLLAACLCAAVVHPAGDNVTCANLVACQPMVSPVVMVEMAHIENNEYTLTPLPRTPVIAITTTGSSGGLSWEQVESLLRQVAQTTSSAAIEPPSRLPF